MILRVGSRFSGESILAVFSSLRDKGTPWYARTIMVLALMYVLSPVDLIPDLIPLQGIIDDLLVAPFMIRFAVRFIPEDVWERNKLQEEELRAKVRKLFCGFLLGIILLIAAVSLLVYYL